MKTTVERHRAYSKKYYWKNREKILAKRKVLRATEGYALYMKLYFQTYKRKVKP